MDCLRDDVADLPFPGSCVFLTGQCAPFEICCSYYMFLVYRPFYILFKPQLFLLLESSIRAAEPLAGSGWWCSKMREAHFATPPTRSRERRRSEPGLKSENRHTLSAPT